YRDSLFKQQPGRYVILGVRLRLHTRPVPRLNYAPLAAAWHALGLKQPDSRVISRLVCDIRRSKLPDPARLGNAGSFFKNPLVSGEQAGWKGHSRERVGVHREQALVLVNLGGARGGDIMTLARDIQEDIERRFGLQLEMEPQLLGN